MYILKYTDSQYASANPKLYTFKHTDVTGYIGGLAFSHDHNKLITTGGQHAMMWDLNTGQKVITFPPYSGYYAVDFSQDDK